MKYEAKDVRNLIPQPMQDSFDDIVYARVLGASKHIRMIADMFISIADAAEDNAPQNIEAVKEYFQETRGKSSYAIVTALNDMMKYISISTAETYSGRVREGINEYFSIADDNTQRVINYGRKILDKCSTVMVFDYSSTVEKTIVNSPKKLKVYVPESRAIDGGFPFVKSFAEKGHDVCFIPDAAMLSVLKNVDAVFIGAETFYPDGTAFNTVGSDILAELCRIYHIPYYVLTPLLKADLRSVYGDYKETIAANIKDKMSVGWPDELKKLVCFDSVELVSVDPKLITFFITERGIVRPENLFQFFSMEVCNESK